MKNSIVVPLLLSLSLVVVGCGRQGGVRSSRQKQAKTASNKAFERVRSFKMENTESYEHLEENQYLSAVEKPLSTFSIDVDTASYTNTRRFLNSDQLPPPDAVRIEEFINYFDYAYQQPEDDKPFSVHTELASCPWNSQNKLVRIGLKGKEIEFEERPASNFVFLVDVSGSMNQYNKLPLVKSALRLLVEQLTENDRIAIVTYSGYTQLALPSTCGTHRNTIMNAIDNLNAGGSTNGAGGIHLAYKVADENFISKGINRVILCTDGDFNVGISSKKDLIKLIQKKAKTKVQLSVLGFGEGNYKDAAMEHLADKGNGNYSYIDTLKEAGKVMVDQASGTLITIAKDVKIQVDFNPAKVSSYRLIGYENRKLADQDFLDDKKDAGEIGAGHTVTAMYEVVPIGFGPGIKPSKYQKPKEDAPKQEVSEESNELLTVRLRYKTPESEVSTGFEIPLMDNERQFENASSDFKFAASVAAFGMILRDSEYKSDASFENIESIANENRGSDPHGYRKEFINLVKKATNLKSRKVSLRD